MLWAKDKQTFCANGQTASISVFLGHFISVANTELCQCSAKAAICSMETNGNGYIPIKCYLQKQTVGETWPGGSRLLTPAQHLPAYGWRFQLWVTSYKRWKKLYMLCILYALVLLMWTIFWCEWSKLYDNLLLSCLSPLPEKCGPL